MMLRKHGISLGSEGRGEEVVRHSWREGEGQRKRKWRRRWGGIVEEL